MEQEGPQELRRHVEIQLLFLNDDLQAFYMHSKNWKGIHCYEEQSLFFKICLELLYGYREH